jgi:hypothetical protein
VVIELPDEMFARLVKLSQFETCVETWGEKGFGYLDGERDGQIDLARAFLDEAVIVHD